jgi:hypothetical protein
LFHIGSAFGIYPSERSPLERYPNVSARKNPHAVFPGGTAVVETTTRPVRPRLLGFDPFESPLRPGVCLARQPVGCSLGFRPFQGSPAKALAEISPSLLSRASPTHLERQVSVHHRVSIGFDPVSPVAAGKPTVPRETTLLGFLHLFDPAHLFDESPGLCVHLMPCRALLSTNRQSLGDSTSYRS